MLKGMSVFGVNSGMVLPAMAIRSLSAVTFLPPRTGDHALDHVDAKAGAQGLSNSFVAGCCVAAVVKVDCDLWLRNLLLLPAP